MDRKRKLSLPRGVGLKGYSSGSTHLYINFTYQLVECREFLRLEPTKANIAFAVRKRNEIIEAIAKNSFNYAEHFPSSKRAKLFGHVPLVVPIKKLLLEYLDRAKKILQPSTHNDYRKSVHGHLIPYFGKIAVANLTSFTIRTWVESKHELTLKRIRNILTPLDHVLELALNDGLIKENPRKKVVLRQLVARNKQSKPEVEPFNNDEIKLILAHCKGPLHNLLKFAFFSGLRTSELIALNWQDVDLAKGTVKVNKAWVQKEIKTTKTKAGIRIVKILPPAIDALKAQKEHTSSFKGRVFYHPKTGKPFVTDKQIRESFWRPLLLKAGVKYRKAYNTRHTFACISIYMNKNVWEIANQLGHKNPDMIYRHYGTWLESADKHGYTLTADWDLNK